MNGMPQERRPSATEKTAGLSTWIPMGSEMPACDAVGSSLALHLEPLHPMSLISRDCHRERHQAWDPHMGQRNHECFSLVRWHDMAHNTTFVSGIGDVSDHVAVLIGGDDMVGPKMLRQRWCQCDLEGQR